MTAFGVAPSDSWRAAGSGQDSRAAAGQDSLAASGQDWSAGQTLLRLPDCIEDMRCTEKKNKLRLYICESCGACNAYGGRA